MRTHSEMRGFTLVEMMVTILIFGLLLAFSVPAFQSMNQTQKLHGAAENIAAQLRLAREKALATGTDQVMCFATNYPAGTTWDYHVHNNNVVGPGWSLPDGISYSFMSFSADTFRASSGQGSNSGIVVLRNRRDERDTISVQLSGMVLCD